MPRANYKKYIVSAAGPLGGGRATVMTATPRSAVLKGVKAAGGKIPAGTDFIVTQVKTPDGKARQFFYNAKSFPASMTFKHTAKNRAAAKRQFKGRR